MLGVETMGLLIEHVIKKFGDFTAVNDISLRLDKGKMLGFLGRNGAGKTTTFRMILGLSETTTGHITYEGKNINKHMYNKVGYLPEERGLHPKMTVEEELTYLATLKGLSSRDIQQRIDYWLERFAITENRKKRIQSLSKGNQQKIQLLASMLHEPELLILDEPFSGLDPVNVELLKRAVKDLNDKGSTIIYSSHRMEHVEELCDDVCIIDKGQLVVSGDIQKVRSEHGNKLVIVESDHQIDGLDDIPGILKKEHRKHDVRLTIENEAVAGEIYNTVIKQGYVRRFQVLEPSLNDIFIDKVGELHE